MNRILRRALALAHAVIENARIDGDRIVIGVRPWTRFGLRCPVCGRACECYDRSPRLRLWCAMDLARSTCFLEYRTRRVSCPEHGVLVESVPWARRGSRFTRDFEGWVACLAVRCTASAVAELARVEWHTVGGHEIIAALLVTAWAIGGTRGGLFIGIKPFIGWVIYRGRFPRCGFSRYGFSRSGSELGILAGFACFIGAQRCNLNFHVGGRFAGELGEYGEAVRLELRGHLPVHGGVVERDSGGPSALRKRPFTLRLRVRMM